VWLSCFPDHPEHQERVLTDDEDGDMAMQVLPRDPQENFIVNIFKSQIHIFLPLIYTMFYVYYCNYCFMNSINGSSARLPRDDGIHGYGIHGDRGCCGHMQLVVIRVM